MYVVIENSSKSYALVATRRMCEIYILDAISLRNLHCLKLAQSEVKKLTILFDNVDKYGYIM